MKTTASGVVSVHRQNIICPCCGRMVRGYEPRLFPPIIKGWYRVFKDQFVEPKRGFTWITPYRHNQPDGSDCEGAINRFYVQELAA